MFTQKLNRQPPGLSSQASSLHSNSPSTHFRTRNSFSPASIDLCGLGHSSTAEGLERVLCRMGQEAVWNWMLFLLSHHYPQTLTKDSNLPVPLNLGFKMKDISNGGSFVILLFTQRRERGWVIERQKGIFRTSFSLLFSLLLVLPALKHLLVQKTNFSKNSSSFFFSCFVLFPSNQAAPSFPIFGIEVQGKKAKGRGSKGETLLKETTRTRGPRRHLLERLVRDFQPLTSVAARSPT